MSESEFLGRVVDAHRIVIGLPSKRKSRRRWGGVRARDPTGFLTYEDIVFGSGLAHSQSSTEASAVPLKLDVYCPDTNSTNRPVLMFIHGGGFTGGIKHKPEIVEMGKYYAS